MSLLVEQSASAGLWERAERVKASWREGRPADTAAAIREHPALAASRSIVIDLAYEEFLQREQAGLAPDPAEFARRFPDFQASVQEMIEAHYLFVARPELLAEPETNWPAVGETLEGLELRGELGRGSFGRAYLAFDPEIERMRVIKLTPGGSAEAKLIGSLHHPNVIDVLWARRVGRRTAVCMPFVGSVTLSSLLERTRGKLRTAAELLDATGSGGRPDSHSAPVIRSRDSVLVATCAIGAKIAAAIHYLHTRRVIHGDIKPSNIVLEPGGSPRVIDFNLAAGEEPALSIRGTPAYMAPELLEATIRGGDAPRHDGVKADLFALGVTLVELLNGRHPYRDRTDGTLVSLADAARSCKVELPSALPASIARQLRACLAVNPADRPDSAAKLAEELDRFIDRERTRFARRVKVAVALAGGLVFLGIVSGMAAALPEKPGMERPPETGTEYRSRGMESLRGGKPEAARADFLSAHERTGDSNDLALAAYCYSLTGDQDTAIEWNRKAIDGGADTPEVRTNLAAALIKASKFDEALVHLDAALSRSSDLRAARYNRALARYQLALKFTGKPKQKELLQGAVDDISAVLSLEPASAELHADAARIFALASPTDAALADRALDQLEAAVKAGHDPAKFAKEPVLKQQLGMLPRFAELANLTAGRAAPRIELKLVEPPN